MKERLHKILARAGVASRRAAEELIRQGRVSVDGKIVTEMGVQVDPERHAVAFDGRPVSGRQQKIYVLLNKPKGYVTTLSDPQGRPIVTSLLKGISARLYPVGRLDLDTEGALLLTNDGELAQKIQHPSHEVKKTYVARVRGRPDREKLLQLEKGLEIEGRRTWPAQIHVVACGIHDTTIRITIHEGRKRQIRKMFAAVGHRVLDLKRTAYGGLELGDLPLGKYRFLDDKEISRIFDQKNPLYKKKSI